MQKMRQEEPFRLTELIVVVNIVLRCLNIFVKFMAFEKSSQLLIHYNKNGIGEEKYNHSQHGSKPTSKRENSKGVLARSYKLEHSQLEQKSHSCSLRCDSRGGLEGTETNGRSLQNFWVDCLYTCPRGEKEEA